MAFFNEYLFNVSHCIWDLGIISHYSKSPFFVEKSILLGNFTPFLLGQFLPPFVGSFLSIFGAFFKVEIWIFDMKNDQNSFIRVTYFLGWVEFYRSRIQCRFCQNLLFGQKSDFQHIQTPKMKYTTGFVHSTKKKRVWIHCLLRE